MSTTMPKVAEINRKWYIIDAAGESLGRTAAKAAALLRGKHRVDFTPNTDCGDHVIIINAEKAVLTGNKLEKKTYNRFTGWIGNLKTVKYGTLMKNNPEKAMMLAIKGMVPDNTLGRSALTRVRIYRGAEHKHEAQQPKMWNE